MGEALGYVEQLPVFRCQVKALPFTKGLRALPQVHRHIVDRAVEYLHQLVLAVPALEVETAQNALSGTGAQLLPGGQLNAMGGKNGFLKGLGEPAPIIRREERCN